MHKEKARYEQEGAVCLDVSISPGRKNQPVTRAELLVPERMTILQKRYGRLTKRDLEMLVLLMEGYKDREIADHLAIKHGTVRNQLLLLYRKLQVRTRTEAVVKCLMGA